ncbi:MAG: hypothetical protein LUD68_05630 [Rikenellaceae bacterium]|nr:hypothetical protein [Rikenellaceae bacterium]
MTGIVLSLLFLMWFLSGIVMIHHSFPRVSQQDRMQAQQPLRGTLPDLQTILSVVPDSVRLQSLRVEMFLDTPVAELQGRDYLQTVTLDTFEPLASPPDFAVIDRLARAWCSASVLRVEPLHKLDQWIPFGRNREELPVYKYFFDDPQQHQLYISSRSGRVLQFTDKQQRFWAWLGAIPHWVYFTSLRQHQAAWSNFVK